MAHYDNKMMTTKTPGVTVILFGDIQKRGGDGDVEERIRNGERERERIAALLRGEKPKRYRKPKTTETKPTEEN